MPLRGWLTAGVLLVLLPGIALSSVKVVRHDLTSKAWTNEYDSHFRKYTKRYFGAGFNWHWFKSQGIAESGLRNDAVSHAGAVGIMQIMPTTYEEIHRKSPYLSAGTLHDPRWNIAAGIFYDRVLYKRWKRSLEHAPVDENLYLTFASYNAGYGKMSRVVTQVKQEKGNSGNWDDIKRFAPSQTRHYVSRIKFLMGKEQ
jgi:membrane-bound lytic murein transglycosylase F